MFISPSRPSSPQCVAVRPSPCSRGASAGCHHGGHTGVLGPPWGEWGRGVAVARWGEGGGTSVGVLEVPGRCGGAGVPRVWGRGPGGLWGAKSGCCPPSWSTLSACCWSTRRPPTRSATTALAQVRGEQAGCDPPRSLHPLPPAPSILLCQKPTGEPPHFAPVPLPPPPPLLPARGGHLCPLHSSPPIKGP